MIVVKPIKEFFYQNQNILALKGKCEITTDEESVISNFGQYEKSIIEKGEAK
ncbi:MAG: hypothetical protein LBL38_01795 [Lactobacillales bacterium]|jgi:hypothetical protein|nr:hypothetical protein [Lactobacillales bacterium]